MPWCRNADLHRDRDGDFAGGRVLRQRRAKQAEIRVLEKVRADQLLTKDSVETDYRADSVGPDGEVRIMGTATAFVIPKVDTKRLRSQLAGLDVGQARHALAQAVPGAAIRIQVWPSSWLPAIPENIAIRVESLPATA